MLADLQLNELKNRLDGASKVLIALPSNASVDKLASGLALYLALKNSGKSVDIVSETNLQVSHSSLFGVGDVKSTIPSGSGNFVISLDGVVDHTGSMPTVPALEKLDWYPEGQALNLVFHVIPGQRFEPTKIESKHQEGGYNLVLVLGAASLNELASIYIQNPTLFNPSQIINIDNNPTNSNFGSVNLVDPNAASLSEIVAQILANLGINMDSEVATNILSGIYDATANLTGKTSPDTFVAVGKAMQAGGNNPLTAQAQSAPAQPQVAPVANPAPQFQQPVASPASAEENQAGFDLRQVFQVPQMPEPPVGDQSFINPYLQGQPNITMASDSAAPSVPAADNTQSQPVAPAPVATAPAFSDQPNIFGNVSFNPTQTITNSTGVAPAPQSSPEEKPQGEYAGSQSPEMDSQPAPDWLVPKIFKGGSIG